MKSFVKLSICISLIMSFVSCSDTEKIYTITTEKGDIEFILSEDTPLHTRNMDSLILAGFYDNQLFHRCIPEFVIQGGDPHSKVARAGEALGDSTVGYLIPSEIQNGLYHTRGAIGMAREGDDINPERASDGGQFYIVIGKDWDRKSLEAFMKKRNFSLSEEQIALYLKEGGAPHLDGKYTVFGRVTKGMDIVEKIAMEPRDALDRPLQDIRMQIR